MKILLINKKILHIAILVLYLSLKLQIFSKDLMRATIIHKIKTDQIPDNKKIL